MTSSLIPNERRASSRASSQASSGHCAGRKTAQPTAGLLQEIRRDHRRESDTRRAWPIEARLGPSRKLPRLGISQKLAVLQRPSQVYDSPFYVSPANLPSSWASAMAGDRIKRRVVLARGRAPSPCPLSDRAGMPGGCGQVQARVLGGGGGGAPDWLAGLVAAPPCSTLCDLSNIHGKPAPVQA
jgi:hypothetical protein